MPRNLVATLVLLLTVWSVGAHASFDSQYYDADGFPKPEYLVPELREASCFYVGGGWPENRFYMWVDPSANHIYAVDIYNCHSRIRWGAVFETVFMRQDYQYSMPGTVYFNNHAGVKARCEIKKSENERELIPSDLKQLILQSFEGDRLDKDLDLLEQFINQLMSRPDFVDFLNKAMPLECELFIS